MSENKRKRTLKKQQVDFSIYAPEAEKVFLSGDFNQWDGLKHQMEKSKLGVWEKTLMLAPGAYEYKFVIDGKWCEEPRNDCCPNPFGTYNNLVKVLG